MEISTLQRIVIVDNDSETLDWLQRHLEAPSLEISTTQSAEEAIDLFRSNDADLLIAEFNCTPFDGLTLLKKVRLAKPNAMVILNGLATSTNAVIEAMRLGAFDVLRREALNFEIRQVAERALQSAEQIKAAADKSDSGAVMPPQPSDDLIIGRSPAMQDVYKMIGRVARADVPVLITGESGVGKEVVSNAIHSFSRRSKEEYVAINCAAIPSNLLESELFGHEKGSFTGAVAQRVGRFEQCDGGTLFLDEIGEMPLEVQSKLLRVLQSGEFSRVGGNQTLQSNVRILAATNKQLEEEVEAGAFREDLFYRLNVVRIHIPPLRRRLEDIRLLAEHFLHRQTEKGKVRAMQFSNETIEILEGYNWPGNVRELENLIQRACVLATGNVLLPDDLPLDSDASRPPIEAQLQRSARRILRAATRMKRSPLDLARDELLKVALEGAGSEEAACDMYGFEPSDFESLRGSKPSEAAKPAKTKAAKKKTAKAG